MLLHGGPVRIVVSMEWSGGSCCGSSWAPAHKPLGVYMYMRLLTVFVMFIVLQVCPAGWTPGAKTMIPKPKVSVMCVGVLCCCEDYRTLRIRT